MRRLFQQYINRWLHKALNAAINNYVIHQKKLFVIQLGANDGIQLDPIHKWIKRPDTHALLVEPVPYLVQQLKVLYKDFSNVSIRQVAVSPDSEEKDMPFFYLQPKKNIPFESLYSLLGSFSKAHIDKHRHLVPHLDELLVEETVSCETFERIFTHSNFPHLDILHMDIEGLDFKIIESIDFTLCKPSILIFEYLHMSGEQWLYICKKLEVNGYKTFTIGENTTCVTQEAISFFNLLQTIKALRPSLLIPRSAYNLWIKDYMN